MRRGWKMFLDAQAWNGSKRLFINHQDPYGPMSGAANSFVMPFTMEIVEFGTVYDKPTLSETYEDQRDACGDVTGFLQAALDCAWEAGLRPAGFADHANELAAVRYHLEDMRALAKVPFFERGKTK